MSNSIISYCPQKILWLKDQLENLRKARNEGWQEQSVCLINTFSFQDPNLEISRLKDLEMVNIDEQAKLDEAIRELTKNEEKRLRLKALMGRALEIQKIYQESHYVFIHAQMSSRLIFSELVEALVQRECPKENFRDYKFLRMPNLSRSWDIRKYSQITDVHDHEKITQEDLISADGYFYNNRRFESALFFLAHNSNIFESCSSLIQKILGVYYKNLSWFESFSFARRFIGTTEGDSSIVGNLFVICIPKEKSKLMQYRSHPFGVPCCCHTRDSDEILEDLQKGIDIRCISRLQFRLFTPALKKENGVKIFLIPSDGSFQKLLRKNIQVIVKELHSWSKMRDQEFAIYEKLKKEGFFLSSIYRILQFISSVFGFPVKEIVQMDPSNPFSFRLQSKAFAG